MGKKKVAYSGAGTVNIAYLWVLTFRLFLIFNKLIGTWRAMHLDMLARQKMLCIILSEQIFVPAVPPGAAFCGQLL